MFFSDDYIDIDKRNPGRALYVVLLANDLARPIFQVKNEAYLGETAWSQDSDWLIFSVGSQESWKIVAKSLHGEDSFPIVDDGFFNASPCWSERPMGIYYRSDRGGVRDIWFQRISIAERLPQGAPVQITNGANINSLDISRDGKMLTYSKIEKRGNIQALQLASFPEAPRGDVREITEWNLWLTDPDISPNGERIVFSSPMYGERDLFLCDRDGKVVEDLHSSSSSTDYPAWSPDGTRIAYIDGDAAAMELWVLDVESAKKSRLTNNNLTELHPDWSPDGNWIAFSRKNPAGDIWVMTPEGTEARQVTFNPAAETGPRFSPDGKTIAFTTLRGGYWNVWLVPFAGGETKQLTFSKELGGTGVCWSPDGRFIYYCPMVNGVRNIWKISLNGKYKEQLTFFKRPSKQVARMTRLSIYENVLFFANFGRVGDIWLMEQR